MRAQQMQAPSERAIEMGNSESPIVDSGRIYDQGSSLPGTIRTTATRSQPIGFCALIKALMNLPLTSGARIVASRPLAAKKSLASSAR